MPSKLVSSKKTRKRRSRQLFFAFRIPGIAFVRKGLDAVTPNSDYENDFPSRRWPLLLLGALSGFVGILLVWSLIARSEISVQTQGRLRPSQAPTSSRAHSISSSAEIFVKEGDLVSKGQIVMQLDDGPLKSRLRALQNRYASSYVQLKEAARLTKLEFPRDLPAPEISDSLDKSIVRSSLESLRIQKEKVAQLNAQLSQSVLQEKSLRKNIALQEIIVNRHESLVLSGAISELQALQQKQKLSDLRSQLSSNVQEQARLKASLREIGSVYVGSNNDDYSKKLNDLRQIQSEISSTKEAIDDSLLRAPLTGYVFDLSVKVPGVPVRPGDELFQIIPSELLTASVDVPAAQIGFIHQGMEVDVHIDSYPSSSYGVLKGTVISVGRDSVEPSSRLQAPTYSIPVGIQLDEQELVSNGKRYPLKPGMTARVSFNLRTVSVFQRLFDATSSILNPP